MTEQGVAQVARHIDARDEHYHETYHPFNEQPGKILQVLPGALGTDHARE
jgi:hypothetical protein